MSRLLTGLKFGVELHADEEVVCGNFDRLYEASVGRGACYYHTRALYFRAEVVVELISVAVALGNFVRAVRLFHHTAEHLAGICAEAHSAAHLYAVLVWHQVYYAMLRSGVELSGVCVLIAENVARVFDDRRLHTEANAEVGNIVFTGVFCRKDFALYAAVSEAAGDEYSVHVAEEFFYV